MRANRLATSPQKSDPALDVLDALDATVELVRRAAAAGVDLIQVRERDLPARELLSLTERIVAASKSAGARVLVNDRADVAVASGAGVHLTTRSMGAAAVRRTFGDQLLIGVSTHSLNEAREAEAGGADFIVFGPVFDTASKRPYGEPVGLRALAEVAGRIGIPVLAIGGMTMENYRSALDAGAGGIAAISLFLEADDMEETVRRLKAGL